MSMNGPPSEVSTKDIKDAFLALTMFKTEDEEIREILTKYKVVAVVGASRDPRKDAHTVPRYLKEKGYRVVPVNPFADEILGEKAYKSLKDIPFSVDIIDIFRPSDQVGPVVEEALETDAKVIWMQLGIRNEEAAEKARAAGKKVIQDRCMRIELERLEGRA
jgi:predicted CoA-binding protein